jgi:tetratricopeptide (TPR) repeat protein
LGYKTVNQVGIWKDSISLWENVLKISPTNSAYVYNNLASAYEDAGRFDDALKWYDFAIKEGPFIGAPHTGKGRIFFDTGLLDESIKEFNNSIALDPNYEVSHNYLGLVYEKMKKYPEALLEIQTALKIKPDYADAYDSLGLIYWDLVDFNKSEKAFRKAIYLSPLNSKYSRDLLETFRKKGSLGL